MSAEKYIELDVHQATISVAVGIPAAKSSWTPFLESKVLTILEFFAGIPTTFVGRFRGGDLSRVVADRSGATLIEPLEPVLWAHKLGKLQAMQQPSPAWPPLFLNFMLPSRSKIPFSSSLDR